MGGGWPCRVPLFCSRLGCALGMTVRAGWRNAQLAVLCQMLQCSLCWELNRELGAAWALAFSVWAHVPAPKCTRYLFWHAHAGSSGHHRRLHMCSLALLKLHRWLFALLERLIFFAAWSAFPAAL